MPDAMISSMKRYETTDPEELRTNALSDLLRASANLHRHLCPRQVLGVRMGLLAGRILGIDLPQKNKKRLYVFMETDGCAADGVSVATGCWIGRRTLRLLDIGKVAATFVDRPTGRGVRIHPHPSARREAEKRFPGARSRWHAMLQAYQELPDDVLLVVQPVALDVDLEAWISNPSYRVRCQECQEEIINRREVQIQDSLLCQTCAGEAYYTEIE